jgi:putative membrane protein
LNGTAGDEASDGDLVRDPGLAAERTELAWGRSTLALFACGAAIARGLPRVGAPSRPVLGAVLLGLGLVAWVAGIPYARVRRNDSEDPRPVATPLAMGMLAAGTAIVGVAAFSIALFIPS